VIKLNILFKMYKSSVYLLQLMSRYYLDTGILVWNGNGTVGKDLIQKFFEGLPPTEHTLTSLDSQPVLGKYLLCIVVPQRLELHQELAVLQSFRTNAECLPSL
jgi:Nuclear transport factor 2 (NTF2) domain.